MKSIFTTGEAADFCQLSQQTIIRCFDNGRLKGFKVPGSKFRRIPRASLLNFMRDNGIPLDILTSGRQKVLVVGSGPMAVLAADLKREPRFEVRVAATGYEAGMITPDFLPATIILGPLDGPTEQMAICRAIKGNEELQGIRIIATGKLSNAVAGQLTAAGAIAASAANPDMAALLPYLDAPID